jgi:hypothetical protein
MNEVKIRSIDFVISKNKFFIDFLDELELFIREKQFLRKKIPSLCRIFMAVQMRILSARFLKDPFKLDTSLFGSLKVFVSNWIQTIVCEIHTQ